MELTVAVLIHRDFFRKNSNHGDCYLIDAGHEGLSFFCAAEDWFFWCGAGQDEFEFVVIWPIRCICVFRLLVLFLLLQLAVFRIMVFWVARCGLLL